MPHSLQRRSAVDGHKVLVKERYQLLVILNTTTHIVHGGFLSSGYAHAGPLKLFEHIKGADDGPDTVIAVLGSLLEDK